jgi:hypothetical protein
MNFFLWKMVYASWRIPDLMILCMPGEYFFKAF